jgi:acetyltransferase-like isoleucine patch superfamily enzyme
MGVRIHPTAIVEENVRLGDGTSVWDHAHIRHDAELGEQCIVGGKTYIAYGVKIGHRCKLNSFVYVCNAVTLEDGVMIGAGTLFTNDRFPRATTPDLARLRPSEPDEHTLPTHVAAGVSIGAGCVIGNDLTLGRFSMIGMGSVVTKSVAPFHLVVGQPARSIGCVCRCGEPLLKWSATEPSSADDCESIVCSTCGLVYRIHDRQVKEIAG